MKRIHKKRYRKISKASNLEAVFILLMFSLITLLSFLSQGYFFNKKIAIYRNIVARYHVGQSFFESQDSVVVDQKYVTFVITKYIELKTLTRDEKYRPLLDYVFRRLKLNKTIPPEIDKSTLSKKIVDTTLDVTVGRTSKIFNIRDIDPELLLAIIERESSFNPFAFNPNGIYKMMRDDEIITDRFPAYGLMQIWQPTFSWINARYFNLQKKVEELFDIKTNLLFGTILLQYLYTSDFMAHLAGIEPATSGSGVQRSIP